MYSPSRHGLPYCLQKSWVMEKKTGKINIYKCSMFSMYCCAVTCLSQSFTVSLIPSPFFAVCAVEDCVVQNKLRYEELFGSLCGYFTDHHWPLKVYLNSRTTIFLELPSNMLILMG